MKGEIVQKIIKIDENYLWGASAGHVVKVAVEKLNEVISVLNQQTEEKAMSETKTLVEGNGSPTRTVTNISQGTCFTGKIGSYPDRAFMKCRDVVVSIDGKHNIGEVWKFDCVVKNYVECDSKIILKTIR